MILESERRAIVDTLLRYCTAIDTRAFDLVADVFLPNARVDFTDAKGPVTSGADLAAWLTRRMSRFKVLQHYLSNVQVEVEDDDVQATSYILAVHGWKDDDGKMRFFDIGGHYADRFVATATGWRIAERTLQVRWVRGDVPPDLT
ncbi:MAG: nuclear transport factor 2 family protein [Myxococcota bacterium]